MNKKFISINELEPDTVANGRIGSMLYYSHMILSLKKVG